MGGAASLPNGDGNGETGGSSRRGGEGGAEECENGAAGGATGGASGGSHNGNEKEGGAGSSVSGGAVSSSSSGSSSGSSGSSGSGSSDGGGSSGSGEGLVANGDGDGGYGGSIRMLGRRLDQARAASPRSTWRCIEIATPAPPPRQSPTLTALGSRLLMFGGRQGDVTFLNDTWLFDTSTATWLCVRESDELPMLPGLPCHQGRPALRRAGPIPRSPSVTPYYSSAGPRLACASTTSTPSTQSRCSGGRWLQLEAPDRPRAAVTPRAPSATTCSSLAATPRKSPSMISGTFSVSRALWSLVRAEGAPSGRVGHTLTALGSRLLLLGGERVRHKPIRLFSSRL